LIEVRVHPHPFFERRGNDLYCELPLTVSEAVLGGKVEVPTRDGMATMTIPPSTQSGQTFRLKGKGVPLLKGKGAGDQYVKVQVVTPKNVGEEGQRLIKRWQELFPENPRAGTAFRGFKR
jgi:DnaJ-class molecular chaperone